MFNNQGTATILIFNWKEVAGVCSGGPLAKRCPVMGPKYRDKITAQDIHRCRQRGNKTMIRQGATGGGVLEGRESNKGKEPPLV